MPGVNNRFVVCDMCGKFRFIADDMVWRDPPTDSEFLMGVLKRFGKKDICHNCLQIVKSQTKVSKKQVL